MLIFQFKWVHSPLIWELIFWAGTQPTALLHHSRFLRLNSSRRNLKFNHRRNLVIKTSHPSVVAYLCYIFQGRWLTLYLFYHFSWYDYCHNLRLLLPPKLASKSSLPLHKIHPFPISFPSTPPSSPYQDSAWYSTLFELSSSPDSQISHPPKKAHCWNWCPTSR